MGHPAKFVKKASAPVHTASPLSQCAKMATQATGYRACAYTCTCKLLLLQELCQSLVIVKYFTSSVVWANSGLFVWEARWPHG